MAIQTPAPLSGNTKIRWGVSDCRDLPMRSSELVEQGTITATTLAATPTTIPSLDLTKGGQAPPPARGKVQPLEGAWSFQAKPEDQLTLYALAQQFFSTVESPTGVFNHTMSPSETEFDAQKFLTVEQDLDNVKGAQRYWGGQVSSLTFTLAPDAMFTIDVAMIFGRFDTMGDPVPGVGVPDLGVTQLRGFQTPAARKLTAPWADIHVELLDATPTAIILRSKVGPPDFITGTVTADGSTTVVGTGTLFTEQVQPGDILNIDDTVDFTVDSVTSDLALEATAVVSVLGPVPAFSKFGAFTSTHVEGTDTKGQTLCGDLIDSRTGRPIGDTTIPAEIHPEVSLPSFAADLDLTGTFVISGTGLTGTGSSLLTEIEVGDEVTVGSSVGRISAIASDLAATFLEAPGDDAGPTAGTKRLGYAFPLSRADFVKTVSAEIPFSEVMAELNLDGEVFRMSAFTLTLTKPVTAPPEIGGPFNESVLEQGFREVALTGTRQQRDDNLQEALMLQQPFTFSIVARDRLPILAIGEAFHDRRLILSLEHVVPSGPTVTVADAATRDETLTATGYIDTGADLVIQVQTARATILP